MKKYLRVKYEFESEEEKRAMVEASEHNFFARLDSLCDRVTASDGLEAITLCGPTCSGKTTVCGRITAAVAAEGRSVLVVSIDDFFKDREELNRSSSALSGEIDYDSPSALDFDYLEKAVDDLFAGRTANIPVYDFHTGKRVSYKPVTRSNGDILLFEGIQVLYPEFTKLLVGHKTLSVYTSVEHGYDVGGERFSSREIRLIRRIVRDYKFRNSPPAFTLYLWKSVIENEDKNIFPNREKADIFVNSALLYELSAIKNELLPILDQIPSDSEYRKIGEELAEKFERIETISTSYIPTDSIFREFIGR